MRILGRLARYADVFRIIQRATSARRAISKSTILRCLPFLTPKQLEATLDGLLRSRKVVRIRDLNELTAVVISKASTYFSMYLPGSKLRDSQWFLVPYMDGQLVDAHAISEQEIKNRSDMRSALDDSVQVRELAHEIASEIRSRDLGRADTAQIAGAIKRWLESKVDDILGVTGIGFLFK